jgi:hypothetical protein
VTSPLVSVVMPAYGHERFVGRAIESVLGQTLEDWELIVIDDDSPDGTWGEIQRFRDPRISVARHVFNRGAHATLNEGLARARGRYIAILNSDDVYHARRLERLVSYLEGNDLDLVGSEVRLIDADGALIDDQGHEWIAWYRGQLDLLRSSAEIADALLAGNVFVTTSNFLFRHGLAARLAGFANLRYAHDYAFLLAAITHGNAAVAILTGEPLLDYRWHGTNTIREGAWRVGRETFGVVCQYVPLLLPEDRRTKMESALRHLSNLSQACPDRESGEMIQIAAEVNRLLGELDRLCEEKTRLAEEKIRLAEETRRLRSDLATLRASYSLRLGVMLLHPMRRLRELITGRR